MAAMTRRMRKALHTGYTAEETAARSLCRSLSDENSRTTRCVDKNTNRRDRQIDRDSGRRRDRDMQLSSRSR